MKLLHSTLVISIFNRANDDYHRRDELIPELVNPEAEGTIAHVLYTKGWIDAVQWHLEDEIRNPAISAEHGWELKKEIDSHNQWRTDTVEQIDRLISHSLREVRHKQNAVMNSETPGNILDRLSILGLKIYHMKLEAHRKEAGTTHMEACHEKLAILMEQEEDLAQAFDRLMDELASGLKYMKVYYQMKMYNDKALNPAMYGAPKKKQ